MGREVFLSIKKLLDSKKVKYNAFEHMAVTSSEHAAKIREKLFNKPWQEIMEHGAKAMIIKSKDQFYQFILPGSKKMDFKKVRGITGGQPKFASPEEVLKITDCVINSVPPFGNLFNLKVYVDKSLLEKDYITFNAGELTVSIDMKTKDWLKAVEPEISRFAT